MTTFAALPNESLVDYLARVLAEARSTRRPVRCDHDGDVFLAEPEMTSSDMVNAWFDAHVTALRGSTRTRRM